MDPEVGTLVAGLGAILFLGVIAGLFFFLIFKFRDWVRKELLWFWRVDETVALLAKIEGHLREMKERLPARAQADVPGEPAPVKPLAEQKDSFFPTAEQVEMAKGGR